MDEGFSLQAHQRAINYDVDSSSLALKDGNGALLVEVKSARLGCPEISYVYLSLYSVNMCCFISEDVGIRLSESGEPLDSDFKAGIKTLFKVREDCTPAPCTLSVGTHSSERLPLSCPSFTRRSSQDIGNEEAKNNLFLVARIWRQGRVFLDEAPKPGARVSRLPTLHVTTRQREILLSGGPLLLCADCAPCAPHRRTTSAPLRWGFSP